MNKVIMIGRLTRDPEVRYSQDNKAVARYTLAVDRHTKEQSADFIRCVAFGHAAEFAEKYLKQGIKIAIVGHLQTGSYRDRDGRTVYTTDVIIEEQEFAESKKAAGQAAEPADQDGFLTVPDDVADKLPFQ